MDYAEGQREMSDGTQVFLRRWTPDGREQRYGLAPARGVPNIRAAIGTWPKSSPQGGYETLGVRFGAVLAKRRAKKGHLRYFTRLSRY